MSKHAGPVVHVIGELARAGAELFVCRLASALSRQGQPVEIWVLYPAECIHADRPTALQDEKELRAELEQAGLTVRFLDKRPRRDYLSTWRRLRRLARMVCPVVVHAHLEEISFHVGMALSGCGIPLVQTMHSQTIRRTNLLRHLFRRQFARFVCISAAVQQATAAYIPAGQLVLIPNGIPLHPFLYPDRNRLQPVRRLIAVGRLSEVKNHDLMIRAFARVRQELERDNCPVPRLTIYGEGDCRPQLEALVAELQLADFVCLPGVSKHIADHLKEADIYLMSSNYEGMSIALLEAMAAGLPIAVTAVSGTKDLLIDGENACISPVGDQAALAASIMRFIRSPELRERCGHRAEESARQFGISACAAKHLELYRSLTHGSSATCNE